MTESKSKYQVIMTICPSEDHDDNDVEPHTWPPFDSLKEANLWIKKLKAFVKKEKGESEDLYSFKIVEPLSRDTYPNLKSEEEE